MDDPSGVSTMLNTTPPRTLPALYSFRRCPYAMRARLALAAGRQHCEVREVVLRDKPPQLLQASPKGTVPVLVLTDGTVIDESLDIMLWALSRNDPLCWLEPQTATPADMMALIARCDSDFKASLDRYKYPQRYGNVDPLEHRARCAAWLAELEKRLAASGALCGNRASLADAAIMPFVRQYAQVDRSWFDRQPWPQLMRWLNDWTSGTLFQSVMDKYAPWDGQKGILFPPP